MKKKGLCVYVHLHIYTQQINMGEKLTEIPFLIFLMFLLFIFEREIERETECEWGRETQSEAGSKLSAQSLTRGSNSRATRS